MWTKWVIIYFSFYHFVMLTHLEIFLFQYVSLTLFFLISYTVSNKIDDSQFIKQFPYFWTFRVIIFTIKKSANYEHHYAYISWDTEVFTRIDT